MVSLQASALRPLASIPGPYCERLSGERFATFKLLPSSRHVLKGQPHRVGRVFCTLSKQKGTAFEDSHNRTARLEQQAGDVGKKRTNLRADRGQKCSVNVLPVAKVSQRDGRNLKDVHESLPTSHISEGSSRLDRLYQPSKEQLHSAADCSNHRLPSLSLSTAFPALVSPAVARAGPVTHVVSAVERDRLGAVTEDSYTRFAESIAPLWPLAFAKYDSVSDVPNPRTHGGWVVDDASVMSDSQREHVEQVAQKLKDETGAEIAVVTVDKLWSMTTPKAFATRLFNTWGIGDREKNNGVLVLLVKDARRLEIEVGRGLNAPFNKASWLQSMQKQTMVPLLKKDDFGGGLVAGVDALVDKLRAVEADPAAAAQAVKEAEEQFGTLLALLLGFQLAIVVYGSYRDCLDRKRRKEFSASLKGSSRKKSRSTGSGSRSTSYYDEYYVSSPYRSGRSTYSSSGSSSSSSSSSSGFGGGSSSGGGSGSNF